MTHVCGYVLHFCDGQCPEEQVLHRGTLRECEDLGRLISAVCYSGSRPLSHAEFVIVKLESAARGGEGDQ